MSPRAMTQPRSILLATDLADLDFLLPVALQQGKETGALVRLLHVISPRNYASIESQKFSEAQMERALVDAEETLRRAAAELREQNVAAVFEVGGWRPIEGILQYVRENRVERLIIGTSSRGKLGKLLVGSVAEELIRRIEIPVCTVGPHVKTPAPAAPRRVLFALSLRHHPEQSFQFASELASQAGAELTVLHVSGQEQFDDGAVAGARAKIAEIVSVTNRPVHIRMRTGEAAEEILAECAVLEPSALVLGSVRASIVSARLRNGVVYRVIAQAPCPTFTLRSGVKAKERATYREFASADGLLSPSNA